MQAADDFIPSPGAVVPQLTRGNARYLGVPSLSFLFYNTIEMYLFSIVIPIYVLYNEILTCLWNF